MRKRQCNSILILGTFNDIERTVRIYLTVHFKFIVEVGKNMRLDEKNNSILELKYIGEDFWSRPVYRGQFGHLWKDIDLGDSEWPNLCSSVGDEFEGEPNASIKQRFTIQGRETLISNEKKFQYQMLSRLKSDCDYYLGYGNRCPSHLWGKTEKEHIESMKAIWLGFSEMEKPEWLTWEQIIKYEEEMCI